MVNMANEQVLIFEKKVFHSKKVDKDFYVVTCVYEAKHDKFDMFISLEQFNNAVVGEYTTLIPVLDNFGGKVNLNVALNI